MLEEYSVRHDIEGHRYVLCHDGQHVGEAQYLEASGVRDFNHTEIAEEYQGKGLSSFLIEEALKDTQASNITIIPTCSAVAHFLSREKNAQYRELVN